MRQDIPGTTIFDGEHALKGLGNGGPPTAVATAAVPAQ